MTVDMSKYEELLQQFGGILDNHIRGEVLENVKEKYRDEIHSKRVRESIVNISSLLQVLKKREVLQYNDINALIEINNEYVRDESIKQQLEYLIIKYHKWLDTNSGCIKFLYNSGKSNVLLTSHDNVPETLLEVPEIAYLNNNINENFQTSTEDMTKESLLKNESLIIVNIPRNETYRNSFYTINLCPLKTHKNRKTIVLVKLITLTFISIIIFGIIWISFILPHGYTAVMLGDPSTQGTSGQSQLNMPFYMASTTTASYSTQSTFSANHTQIYSTSEVPPGNREYELRQKVVRQLSKQIGNYWKDVCRGLDINENTIDEITIEYSLEPPGQKYEKMFKKGMTIYFSEPRPQWKVELLKALKAAKRVDLQEKVQEIIHNHSNL